MIRQDERGAVLVESALLMLPLIALLLGTTVVGINLGRSVHAAQVNRDAGSMYVRGVNFSIDANKDIVVRLASGLGMTRDGGSGVVHLSKVTFVSERTCRNLNLSPCNANQLVVTQRLVIGNAGLKPSQIGTPSSHLLNAEGLVYNFKQEGSAVAQLGELTLQEGEYAFVAESYFETPVLNFDMQEGNPGVYSRSVF